MGLLSLGSYNTGIILVITTIAYSEKLARGIPSILLGIPLFRTTLCFFVCRNAVLCRPHAALCRDNINRAPLDLLKQNADVLSHNAENQKQHAEHEADEGFEIETMILACAIYANVLFDLACEQ